MDEDRIIAEKELRLKEIEANMKRDEILSKLLEELRHTK